MSAKKRNSIQGAFGELEIKHLSLGDQTTGPILTKFGTHVQIDVGIEAG